MSASDGWISGISGISTTGFWTMVTVTGLALIGLVVLGIICTKKSNEGKPFKLKVSLKKVLTFEFESGQPTVVPPVDPVAEIPQERALEVGAPKLIDSDPPKNAQEPAKQELPPPTKSGGTPESQPKRPARRRKARRNRKP